MGNPDGGWFDEEPPYVVATSPMENAVNYKGRRVYLLFNEYIKVENIQEKVVVSPPQIEQPEIKVQGKRIRVQLEDTLKADQTYTIDFSDAISDNNEGNPLGNYTFTFSTGNRIDTMEVSGYVLDAETLEPVKGLLVGLYDAADFNGENGDTIFRKLPMLRVSRSDEKGRYVIKGVARDKIYRVFALQDADGTYTFSQKSEMIGFTDRTASPDCFPDTRLDTIWADALHIKSFVTVPYTHFTPDDIVLRVFQEEQTERHRLKEERKDAECIKMYFTYGHDSLPKFRPLNFDAEIGKEILVEHSLKKDTIMYWLCDSSLINNDSLMVELSYYDTDTLGVLQLKTDTAEFIPKLSFEKRQKLKEEEYKKWEKEQNKLKKKGKPYDSIMPRPVLDLKWTVHSTLAPDQMLSFQSPSPIALIDTSKIHLQIKMDSVWIDKPFILTKDTLQNRKWNIYSDWIPNEEYKFVADSFAVMDVYDRLSSAQQSGFKVGGDDVYGTLVVELTEMKGRRCIGQLLSSSGNVVKEVKSDNGVLEFFYLKGGEYYMKLIVDENGDGKFTTGLYEENRQPEEVYFYHEKIDIKEKWDKRMSWLPTGLPLYKQKPISITKQKTTNKKSVRADRNMKRAIEMGIKYLPDGSPVGEGQRNK
ncbi:MAG: Ig-like domain-containing protein [Bacteroidaceae bacterium]|nr:Ig-like domain-containing protein [Bacteroidaceae bacterium]